MLLIAQKNEDDNYKLILPYSSSCQNELIIKTKISNDKSMRDYHPLFKDSRINIDLIDEQPVNFYESRTKKLQKVRSGEIPKGILKKWPLYVLK